MGSRLARHGMAEKALEKVVVLPPDEQDAIAIQILASLADEEAWRMRFAERGETLPLDDLP
jgi:hypothetical protein